MVSQTKYLSLNTHADDCMNFLLFLVFFMYQSFIYPSAKPLEIQVCRLDLNHPLVSGNKLYKLKPWIKQANEQNVALVSCGGAFSNHLHALAAAGHEHGLPTFGIVRGMQQNKLTVTLRDCQQMGMTLISASRSDYLKRHDADFIDAYQMYLPKNFLWVPEGGTDESSIKSCESIGVLLNEMQTKYAFDSVWIAVGSGGTVAGIARSLDPAIKLFAVPVLKEWASVKERVNDFLKPAQQLRLNWIAGGSYGGFGRIKPEHIKFMAYLEKMANIPFDPVYTSKLLRRLLEIHESNQLAGSRPLVIHTGGLQGRRSVAQQIDTLNQT